MNKQKQNNSMIGRRLLAYLVDVLILMILFFFLYFLLFKPVMNDSYHLSSHKDCYSQYLREYDSIRAEYGIISFGSDSSIIYNQVMDEIKNAFLNDGRIIQLTKEMQYEAKYVFTYTMLGCFYSILCSSSLIFIIIPLCIKTKTIGRLCMKLTLIKSKEKKYLPWYFVMIRGVVFIVLDVILGTLTLGIVPLVDLLVAVLSKDNRSIIDYLSFSRVIDGVIPLEFIESADD